MPALLPATTAANRILVSYDIATLPNLAQHWLEEGRRHAGLLILPGSINQRDLGAQPAAIESTLQGVTADSWADQLIFGCLTSD